jgi:ribosomal protein S18 acetylase RimI-like enzyme
LPPTALIIDAATPADLDALIALYEAAFLASERKPSAVVRAMASDPAYRVGVARQGGAVVGFAILFRFPGGGLALLEYMAVDPEHRAQGIGEALFRDAVSGLDAGVTLTVEVEADAAPHPDQADRARRKAFYRRLGCLEVEGLDYRVPLPGGPPPMNLMVWRPTATEVVGVKLRDWLGRLYRDGYGVGDHDPRFTAMTAGLPARARLI